MNIYKHFDEKDKTGVVRFIDCDHGIDVTVVIRKNIYSHLPDKINKEIIEEIKKVQKSENKTV